MKKLFVVILFTVLLPLCVMAQQKEKGNALVEVSGVVVTSDNLRQIPGVNIHIKDESRGSVANDEGVFSLVAEKGDTLVFSIVGFKENKVIVPKNYKSHFMSLAVPMSQDTTYLPPMVVHSYPSRGEFAYAFLHWRFPGNQYELAKANTTAEKLRAAMYFTPVGGGEGVNQTFRSQQEYMRTQGQIPTSNIFNPLAWAKFIKAIKDGDFKQKK